MPICKDLVIPFETEMSITNIGLGYILPDILENSEGANQEKPVRLVYLVGSYPELTNTFIDREILNLRELGGFEINIVSIRHPSTLNTCSPQQQALYQETLYLLPKRWRDFHFGVFLAAQFFYLIFSPTIYISTLLFLLTGQHPDGKTRMRTAQHFFLGVYAAYLLRKMPFEHIHVHFMDRAVVIALIVSRLLGKKYSFTAHAVDIYTKPVLQRIKLKNACFVVTVSRYNREQLLQIAPDLPAEKIHVLHPWVDVTDFSPRLVWQPHDRLHILSVGRLVEKKGHADLIQACRLAYDRGLKFECRIVGEGPLRPQLEAQITRLGMQPWIRLEGGQSQQRVRELLESWADAFVLPCVIAGNGDRDGIPVSIAEAMAMHLPVISTDIVGIAELVCNGTGFLLQPHDPMSLSQALEKLAAMSPAERTEMGQRGRATVEAEFDLRKGTKKLAVLLNECRREEVRG